MDDLKKLIRSGSTMVRRHGPAMVESVNRGIADETPLPKRKRENAERPPHGGRETERLFQKLKNWRQELVSSSSLPLALSASNNQLKAIAGWRPKDLKALGDLPDVRAWQVDRYGETWLKILSGFEEELARPSRRSPRKRRSRRGGRRGEAQAED
jgi:superfamily II DNA helicase RecQ